MSSLTMMLRIPRSFSLGRPHRQPTGGAVVIPASRVFSRGDIKSQMVTPPFSLAREMRVTHVYVNPSAPRTCVPPRQPGAACSCAHGPATNPRYATVSRRSRPSAKVIHDSASLVGRHLGDNRSYARPPVSVYMAIPRSWLLSRCRSCSISMFRRSSRTRFHSGVSACISPTPFGPTRTTLATSLRKSAHEVLDGRAVASPRPVPVEGGERLEAADAGGAEAALEAAAASFLLFPGDQLGQPAGLAGVVPAGVEAAQAERAGAAWNSRSWPRRRRAWHLCLASSAM